MFGTMPWKTSTSTVLTLSLLAGAAVPLGLPTPATAQLFPSQRNRPLYSAQSTIPRGTTLPVRYDEAEKILLANDETMPLTLIVAANIKDRRERVLIPYGSELEGQLQPTGDGAQFIARTLIFPDGQRLPVDGTSRTITRTEEIDRGTDVGSILQGAAIGAAASAILSAITGDRSIGLGEVFGGAGLGALGGLLLGGRKEAELISINPEEDLDVTLNSDLTLSQRSEF
ncbi:hypothetical protein [Lusitaniella coriacea]|uniref:hypothetical protein n=1 Tax=Lusitaniella coriacea TaxID=1983105 RepID=UPI003CEC2080